MNYYCYNVLYIIQIIIIFALYIIHIFKESGISYPIRVIETINTVLESDLPDIFNIDRSSVIKLKKFVYLLASMSPFKPNILKLSETR